MYLEKCGILFFSKIRPIFFFALVLSPLLVTTFFLYQEALQLQDLQERFRKAYRKESLAMDRKGRKERFIERYSHANPYFLDQTIESYLLLQKEKRQLESLINHPAFPDSPEIQERLKFIDQNRLAFSEEKIENSSILKEVYEKQRHPVQMDESDLKQILALLEDVPIAGTKSKIDAPQILIKDFRLKKVETPIQTQAFEVEMELIKQEFTKP